MKFIALGFVVTVLVAVVSAAPAIPDEPIPNFDDVFQLNKNEDGPQDSILLDAECVRNAIARVVEQNDLDHVWESYNEQLTEAFERYAACPELEDAVAIAACQQDEAATVVNIYRDFYQHLLSDDQLNIIAQIQVAIISECRVTPFSALTPPLTKETSEQNALGQRLQCAFGVVGEVSEELGLGELWAEYNATLVQRMNNVNRCQQLENEVAVQLCVAQELAAAQIIIGEYLAAVAEVNEEAAQHIVSEVYRQCSNTAFDFDMPKDLPQIEADNVDEVVFHFDEPKDLPAFEPEVASFDDVFTQFDEPKDLPLVEPEVASFDDVFTQFDEPKDLPPVEPEVANFDDVFTQFDEPKDLPPVEPKVANFDEVFSHFDDPKDLPSIDDISTLFESKNSTEAESPVVVRLQCVRDVISAVVADNEELKDVWAETELALLLKIEDLQSCAGRETEAEVRSCYRNGTQEARVLIRSFLAVVNEHNDQAYYEILSGILTQCRNPSSRLLPGSKPSHFYSNDGEPMPQGEGLRCVQESIEAVVERHNLQQEWEVYQTQLTEARQRLQECGELETPTEQRECSEEELEIAQGIVQAFVQHLIVAGRYDVVRDIAVEIRNQCARSSSDYIPQLPNF